MPKEIKDVTRFIELSEKAEVCQVKRTKDAIKLKLRGKHLYTLKVDLKDLDEVRSRIKCNVEEI